MNSGPPRFEKLKSQHEQHFQSRLKAVIQSGPSPGAEVVAVEEAAAADGGEPTVASAAPEFTSFENMDKLKEAEEILLQVPSEVAGIEIVKTKSLKIFLVSEKKRILPKHTLLGGFGTGKRFGY